MTFAYMMTLILVDDDDQVHQFEGRYLVADVKEEVVEGYLSIHIKHRKNCKCCPDHCLLLLNVMIQVSQFVSNSQLCH